MASLPPPDHAARPAPDENEEVANAVELLAQSTVAVRASRHGTASGTIWKRGLIVTAAHAIHSERPIRITHPDGTESSGSLAGVDASTDIALLRVEESSPGSVAEVSDRSVRLGSFVMAVARDERGPAASFGFVGRTGGAWQTWRGGYIDRLIRLDGGLYPGFSGGPIGGVTGQVIGIGTGVLARGFGIVIPTETVTRIAQELATHGRVLRAYLGIVTQSAVLSESVCVANQITDHAALLVTSVAEGSPAAQAGLLVGDTLVELAGRRILAVDDLQAALSGERVGQRLRATLLRGGHKLEVSIELGERPSRRSC